VRRFNFVFANGDNKPVAFQNVVSSTGAALVGATCNLYDHLTGDQIGTTQAMTVSGTSVTSPAFTWNVGQYTLDVSLTFADGVIDNTISVFVNVLAVPT
jgi:hypothetical protein